MRNNKGFSLVELIIVIAIMAILVGVMAPQLIKYIEKTNVSSDTQLCDTVKSAVTTAVMDPSVLNDSNSKSRLAATGIWINVNGVSGTSEFDKAVQETLGMDSTSIATIDSKIKSAHGSGGIQYNIMGSNSVHVRIPNTDVNGKKSTGTGTASNLIIYVD
ncbi:MAG: prepilin-type N-terminal cleavage/methylation domain-containing protein [Lachnospiraceae bacterium]|nr:prepilin-type N-terminal cleavage/methylation domain-containing protein [Lachnospiraceae bacterium]MBQ8301487.1 prepilin-type N-terminal cleavage/methylation domain-containing protein [Clostridia bacterium]